MPGLEPSRYPSCVMSPSQVRNALLALSLLGLTLGVGLAIAGGTAEMVQPRPRPLTYVAIGASDSVGVGADRPEADSWVSILHRRLPEGSQLVNLGVSGSLLHQAVDQQLPVAVDSDPDLVTVWLAVNDLNARVPLERYGADLNTLLGTLRQQTRATILVGNVPDVARLPVYQRFDAEQVRAEVFRWNELIGRTSERHGALLVDLHAGWQELAGHPEYVGRDGFHPSTEGYRRLAEVFFGVLAERTDVV